MHRVLCLFLASAWLAGGSVAHVMAQSEDGSGAALKLEKGDHIAVIGNTLAERMQHQGWLETLLHAQHPDHELVVRNLGFPGDELTLRLRSAAFGSPDEWLTKVGADVVFAFFGANEAWAGPEGIEKFKADLDAELKHLKEQKYNGESAPRVVLFSPIAHENVGSRNLPDGTQHNALLEAYTAAMAEVAQTNDVPFVDLFHPTLRAYELNRQPLTDNGVHLNEAGDQVVAQVIAKALLGESPAGLQALDALREAVNDKNFYWFQRYRTTDGYSIYGGRADLKFTDGQTNREVMQREMEVLDAMTANRDARVWAAARGEELVMDDSNTPPFIPVISNKPGDGPNGEHIFLSGEEALSKITAAPGLKVNLFADESMFPEMVNPVQMAFDTKGRLWVAAWPTYPHWKPKEPMNDKLLILEDTDHDGQADVCKTFAGDLHNPTGFEFWGGGVIVAMAPDLIFLKDTDGDDQYDVKVSLLSGIDSADTHHTSNSFVLDPGGALYFQEGTFHHSQIETPWGPPVRLANAGMFRFEPRTRKVEVFVTHPFANPHGHVVDRWGQGVVHDGTGAVPYHTTLFSGRLDFPEKHRTPPTVYRQRTRPCPGTEILSSAHFPEEMQGDMLVGNVIGVQGILRYKMKPDGSSVSADEQEVFLTSSDPNFRPTDFEIGPDGALYFGDWQNPIIGHMQHNLRDPNRDRTHGRVYRVTYPDRPLLIPPAVAGQPVGALLELLKSPEDRVRSRARIELSARTVDEVIPAAQAWIASLDPNDPEYQHHLMEGLWLHQSFNVVNPELLGRMLESPDYRARAAAVRVLCYWRDRVPNALDLLLTRAEDAYPLVRLEAVRAASFFDEPEAVEIAVLATRAGSDQYLDYTVAETLRRLDPIWKKALADGRDLQMKTPAGSAFVLRNMNLERLLAQPKTREVCREILARPDVRDEARTEAIATLARLDGVTEPRVLIDAINRLDDPSVTRDETVIFDLVRLLNGYRDQLAPVRGDLERLATEAKQPVVRQVGYVALMNLDGSPEQAWALGSKTVDGLRDLVGAVPLVSDPSLKATLYPKLLPLLNGLPESLAGSAKAGGTSGRFVRIALPARGTLTLAEVEVYSGGRNVALRGKATQKDTAHGGEASKAIDGNTSGSYSDGGQTHSVENTGGPWWEVDLGESVPIDSIVIYNRTDGNLGNRLDGYTLTVLNENRDEVFRQERLPAPGPKASFDLGGADPVVQIRHAAMAALTSVRGKETESFKTISAYVSNDEDRLAAIRALQRIPRNFWPAEEAPALLSSVIDSVKAMPASERTSQAALDMLGFADGLTALLPLDEARATRAQLRELGVQVVKLGTLPERMSYDKDVIAVAAGKPVEFLFENIDLMPHNFVITRPGKLEEVGLLGESTATQPDALARNYVPETDQILLASRLLQTRESQRLSWTAPTEAGIYPYVCTYPGHWRRMYGALYVVEDLDAYLADPVAYLASHPMEVKDTMLADRRPRTEWSFDELAQAVEQMNAEGGRSHGNGRQMFQVATCVSCHQMEGVGVQFGPVLTELDPKQMTPVELLRHVLEPSLKIDDKYKQYLFDLESGQIVSGMILEETPEAVKVIENPLNSTEPRVITKTEIVERQAAPTSPMPKGLLDSLTRDEILDLVAYIAAKGDAKSPLFQGSASGHQHGAGHQH